MIIETVFDIGDRFDIDGKMVIISQILYYKISDGMGVVYRFLGDGGLCLERDLVSKVSDRYGPVVFDSVEI